jgi:hypothetical protein
VTEGRNAVSSAVAQDPTEVGAIRESMPGRGAIEGSYLSVVQFR